MAGKTDLSAVKEMTLRILTRRELYGLEIIKALKSHEGKTKNLGIAHFTRSFSTETMGMVQSHWGQDRLGR